MGIAIGHRNSTPLQPGHRYGLNEITPRHGVPFYGPKGCPSFIRGDATILFSSAAIINGGIPPIDPIAGNALIRFIPQGWIEGIYNYLPPSEPGAITANTTVYFSSRGILKNLGNLEGRAMIIFDAQLRWNQIKGDATIQFEAEGILNTNKLEASATILFDASGELTGPVSPVPVTGSADISIQAQGQLSGIIDINYGFLYNWYAVAGIT